MADERTPIEIDDLYELGWVEDPRVSPDGRLLAFVRVTVDRAADAYRRAIWVAPLSGGPPRRFTSGPRSDTQPRWSPDGGTLAFVSDREGDRPQIYLIPADGGEARRVTNAPNGASDPAWSPDGRRLAFRSRLTAEERAREDSGETDPPPEDALDARHARERRARAEERRQDPRVVSRLVYRTGTAFKDGRFDHIYTLDIPEDDDAPPPPARRRTDGDTSFAPAAWSHDGAALVSATARDPQLDTLLGYDDLVLIPVLPEGRAAPALLTSGPGFSYQDPLPSPDGGTLAALRRPDAEPLFAGAHLALVPLDGTPPVDLSSALDLDVETFRWLPDGSSLAFLAGWRGEAGVSVVHTSPQDQATAIVPPAGRIITEFDVGPDGSVVFVAGSAENPCDLFVRRPDGREQQITALGSKLLSRRVVAPFEEIVYPAPDGRAAQGWVVRPPGFDPARAYPLAVHIHGGPHLMWGPGFRSMWHELQAHAARGYVVFFCNPRGSDGYGAAWRASVRGDWGGASQDILAGVEAVIARGGIDPSRVGVTGGSYGGYMTAWLLGHTDRFRCGVAARGVYNLLSFHGTSDAHELIEHEFGGSPWEIQPLLWEQSPLAHAHRITTPLLILHAELDYRVPISEAEQLFSVLRRRGQAVELVRYPREGHDLTRAGEPRHRADHMRRTFAWFDRYCSEE